MQQLRARAAELEAKLEVAASLGLRQSAWSLAQLARQHSMKKKHSRLSWRWEALPVLQRFPSLNFRPELLEELLKLQALQRKDADSAVEACRWCTKARIGTVSGVLLGVLLMTSQDFASDSAQPCAGSAAESTGC